MLICQPRPLFRLFPSFQTNNTSFTTNKGEKCPSCKQCWDLNPQPLGHESPPITIRPGLLPKSATLCAKTEAYCCKDLALVRFTIPST